MSNKQPKVLFYNYGAKFGGAEIVLTKYLEQASPNITYKVLLNEYGPFYDELIERNIPVDVIEVNSGLLSSIKREGAFNLKLIQSIPTVLNLFSRIVKYFKKHRYDLIVSNTYKSHVLVGLAARMYGINAVWRFHDIMQSEYPYNQYSWMHVTFLRFLSRNVRAISAVSNAVADSFISNGFDGSKLSVVHNGLDVQASGKDRVSGEINRTRIGWIGQFTPWKGIEEFINLGKALIDQRDRINYDIEFIIAGSALFGNEQYETRIRSLVTDDYSKYFTFMGHISDIESFYNGIDIYFHTSIAPDPFPTTLLEAGSRGLLIFASELGGTSEVITDNETGYLINILGREATLNKTIEVLNNISTRRTMGEKLRNEIEAKFSKQIYQRNLEAELLGLI